MLYYYIVGYPIAQKITNKACFELSFPITIAIVATLSLLINNIFNVGIIQSIIIFIIPLLISCCICNPCVFFIKDICQNKCILILPIIMSCVIASALFIKTSGIDITFSIPIFDHIKVAVIDSITRNGLPISNPFLISHSNDGVFHYYYLWYLLAANISIIFHISGYSSDIILTFITSFVSILTAFFLVSEICSKKNKIKAQYIICLLLFSGPSIDVINIILNGHLSDILSHNHSLETWIYQAAWVPQHLLSASFVVLSLYLLGTIDKYNRYIFFIIVSLIVSAFGCSVWVGGITFFVISIIIFIYDLITSNRKKIVILNWLSVSIVSILLSTPLIYNMLSAPKRVGQSPIALSIYDTSTGGKLYDLIFFFVGAMPIWITVITISFYIILFKITFHRLSINKECKILLLIGVGSLLTALCIKSQIANNDLGWRAILPFVISGASISSIFFVQFFSETLKYIILIIASISSLSSIQFVRELIYGESYFTPKTSISDFLKIRDVTDKTDRLLNNIHENGYEEREPLRANILPALVMNRSFCFQGVGYARAFGADWGKDLYRMDAAIDRLYKGQENQQDLDLIKQFKCNKIVVTKSDIIWDHVNQNLKQIYSSDKIKIFTIK